MESTKNRKIKSKQGILVISAVAILITLFIGYRTQIIHQITYLIQLSHGQKDKKAHEQKSKEKKEYYCPMHPEVRQNKPGRCPKCGMYLVPATQEPSKEQELKEHEHKQKHQSLYHCPMHPQYISDKPGECPICGMRLVKIDQTVEPEPTRTKYHTVEGRVPIKISPEKQQLIGVKFAYAEKRRLIKTLIVPGYVDFDERRFVRVNARFDGWVEKLYVNYTGAFVKKGQPLAELYSPEVVLAQEEYIVAKRNSERLTDYALRKFNLLNIPEFEIRKLDETEIVRRTLPIRSPASGFVIEKNVVEGQKVSAGDDLYKLADLSYVWIHGNVYGHEGRAIKIGQDVKITSPYNPEKSLPGKINYIYPYLDKDTRTTRIRVDAKNNGELKPGMYVNLEIDVDYGIRLSIPSSAVLELGRTNYVFVDAGDGYFEPREVKLGIRTDDYYEVVEGLSDGEKVISSATFLIDSESAMRYAIELMKNEKGGEKQINGHKH